MTWTLTIITAWKNFAESDFCQINGVFTSQRAFPFYVLNFLHGTEQNRVHCKGEFYIGNIQKLSLDFSHCLCVCWYIYKGINLWPNRILAWIIMVCLFEQHRSWVCSAILVSKSSVMKSLKNSTGREECSTNRLVFSNLRPVLDELRTTEILLQSQLYPLSESRSESRFRSSWSFPSNSTSLSPSISPSSSSSNVPKSIPLSLSLHQHWWICKTE